MSTSLDPIDLAAHGAPDEAAISSAREQLAAPGRPPGSFGRLEDLALWWAGVRGAADPGPPKRPRLVVVTGEHGIAAAGVSALPADWVATVSAGLRSGSLPQAALARAAGVSGRVVNAVEVSGASEPAQRLDHADAITPDVAQAALAAGRAIADAEIDAGTDLLLLGDAAIGSTTAAAVCIAALTGQEPVAAVGRGSGIDDAAWMRKVAAVRDGLWRVRATAAQWEPERLLGVAAGADIAVLTGVVLQAGERRTGVILDGVVSLTAALIAELLASGTSRFLRVAGRGDEPAAAAATERLGLTPVADLDVVPGIGAAALVAFPLLRAATLLLQPR